MIQGQEKAELFANRTLMSPLFSREQRQRARSGSHSVLLELLNSFY
jgi:hypothetical protein